jgi:hypothetical protein
MQPRDAVLGSGGSQEKAETRMARAMERLPSLEVFDGRIQRRGE